MAGTNSSARTRKAPQPSIDDLEILLSQSRASADALAALAVAGGIHTLKDDSLVTMLIHLHEKIEEAYLLFGDLNLSPFH